jgi:hypothetical protein
MKKLPIILTASALVLGSGGYLFAQNMGNEKAPAKRSMKKTMRVHKAGRHAGKKSSSRTKKS